MHYHSQPAEAPASANQELEFGQFEPFVDEHVVSRFLNITPRRVLEMARLGEIPAHPIGHGVRKTWRFLISEIDAHFREKSGVWVWTLNPTVPVSKPHSAT